jgi:hypothetical protein
MLHPAPTQTPRPIGDIVVTPRSLSGYRERVDPPVDTAGRPYPRLEEVRAALAGQRVASEVRAARGAWVAGGDRLLACWRR